MHQTLDDSAPDANLQHLKAALERRFGEPGLFTEHQPRCYGVNLGTFCPCAFHETERDARAQRAAGVARITPRQPWEPVVRVAA